MALSEKMAFIRLSHGDATGFKVLFALAILYGVVSCLVYSVIHMSFVTPLGADAPLDHFSEARAIEHVRVLAEDIGGRQVCYDVVLCSLYLSYNRAPFL